MERVVITGASAGIGAACVTAFQQEGAKVVGVDIAPTSEADQHLQMDIGEPDCGVKLIRFLDGQPVDGLVNNAAVSLPKPAEEVESGQFDRVLSINLRAPLLLAGALRHTLAERQGFVVNVGSVHAVATSKGASVYAASKGGLDALTRALAIEWGPDIRVNSVLPGAIDSDMLSDGLSRTGMTLGDIAARHPVGRVGHPAEVAAAVVFLAKNGFVTGTSLTVDGGATAHLSTE